MIGRNATLLALMAMANAGCAGERGDAPVQPPLRLADTGLYADFASRTPAADVLPFSPQYPLWSDGARKQRWIRLPPAARVDNSDRRSWRFPIGTRLWKEFAFEGRVETRYMELGPDGAWAFVSYVWAPDESDAVLAPERGVRDAYVRDGLRYDIPGRADCRICHDESASAVLGFSYLQLSSDRDPGALHAEPRPAGAVDVATLAERGLLTTPVDPAPRIAARSARERAALGYLHGNCGTCHNDRGRLADLGLVLEACPEGRSPGALATACDRPSRFCPPGLDPAVAVRIRAGDPHGSVLLHRAGSRNPLHQMPPLATRVVDTAALELLAAWIREDLDKTQ